MSEHCSLKQIAEALVLFAMDGSWGDRLSSNDYPVHFRSLDTFITTVNNFLWVFYKKFGRINENNFERCASQEEFVNFLALGCETLSQKRDHFGLLLSCSFAREALHAFSYQFNCLHYDSPTYKFLSEFLQNRFKYLENKSNWYELMRYCKNLNVMFKVYSKSKPESKNKSATPTSSGEDVGNATDEENRKCKSDAIETCIIIKPECPDIVKMVKIKWENIKEMKNISENFNGDTDKCDQSTEITLSNAVSDVSQNDIEKGKTQERNGSYVENNIVINTTSVSSREDIGNERTNERNRRKRKRETIETGIINKQGCPDMNTDEVLNLNEHFNHNINKICDEMSTVTPSKVITDASMNVEIEKNKPQEIKHNEIETKISSCSIEEVESISTSSDESYDEHKEAHRKFYNLLMPDRRLQLEIFGLLRECKTGFHKADDDATTALEDCIDCEGKDFNLRYQEWKMAFKNRYSNVDEVTDYFYWESNLNE